MATQNRLKSEIIVTIVNKLNGEKIDLTHNTFVSHPAYNELSKDEQYLLNTKIFTKLLDWIQNRHTYCKEVYDYNSEFGFYDCDYNGPNGWENAEESMKTTDYKFCLEDIPNSKMYNIVKYFSKIGFFPLLCEYDRSSYCPGYDFEFNKINMENDKLVFTHANTNSGEDGELSVINKLETEKYAYVCLRFW
jgi:hypothetical protein